MFRRSVEWLRLSLRRPRRLFLLLLLLAGFGLGAALAAVNLSAWRHYRAAKRDLDHYRLPEARAHLDRCLEIWPSSFEVHLLAAQTARRLGDFETAEEHLSRCQALRGGLPPEVELEQTLIRAQRGGMDAVMPYLRSLVEQEHPSSPLILEAMAQGYMRAYRYGDAAVVLGIWRERCPDDIEANFYQGYVNEVAGSQQEAVKNYQHVLLLDPENDEARLHLADLLIDRALPAEALEHLQHMSRKRPNDLYIQARLARCFVALGRPEEAEQVLNHLLEENPEFRAALAIKGETALALNQPAEAERWLRKALAVDPGSFHAQYAFARCLRQQGKDQEADDAEKHLKVIEADGVRIRKIIQEDINKTPNDPALRTEIGNILLRGGSDQEGIKWLYSALRNEPRYAPAHEALADYFDRVGQPERAAPHRRFLEGDRATERSSGS